MANISTYLQQILDAVYGEEVRVSIHDAIAAINDELEDVVQEDSLSFKGELGISDGTNYDLNSLVLVNRRGIWRLLGSKTYTNVPSDFDNQKQAYLIVYTFGTDNVANVIKQELRYFSNSGSNANICWSRVYLNGVWYNWHKGVDDTLTVEGVAADAKVAGDSIRAIGNNLSQLARIDLGVKTNNIIDEGLSRTDITSSGLTSSYVYYSGVHISGTLAADANARVSLRTMEITGGQEYTIYVKDDKNTSLAFYLNGQNSGGTWTTVRDANSNPVHILTKNKAHTFTPDDSYTGVSVNVFNVPTASSVTVNNTYHVYLVPGEVESKKFNSDDFQDDGIVYNEKISYGLYSILNTQNIIESTSFEEGYGIVGNVGSLNDKVAAAGQFASEFIPVIEGMILRIKNPVNSTYYKINYYDRDRKIIVSLPHNIYNVTSIVPHGAYYVRFSLPNLEGNEVTFSTLNSDGLLLKGINEIPADLFGHIDGYAIVSSGIRTGYDNYCVTNYLPVLPFSTLDLSWWYATKTYCHAFYDKDFNQIGTPVLAIEDNRSMTAPEGAAYVRFTISLEDIEEATYVHRSQFLNRIRVTPQDFGAKANSINDDTDAIQQAANFAGKYGFPLYFPVGNYFITSPINITYSNMDISGQPYGQYRGSRIILSCFMQEVNDSGAIVYPQENGKQILAESYCECAFLIRGTSSNIRDLIIQPNVIRNISHYDHEPLLCDGIRYYLAQANNANVDSQISNVLFTALNRCIRVKGRNLEIEKCLFSHSNVGIENEWSQRHAYEQREINVTDCRFHSMSRNDYNHEAYDNTDGERVCLKWPDYVPPAGSLVYKIDRNFADYCGDFFSGTAYGVEITNNTLYAYRGCLINSTNNVLVKGELVKSIVGMELFTNGVPATRTGLNMFTFQELGASAQYVSPLVQIAGGSVIEVNFSMNTSVWGHIVYNENNEPIDGVLANESGLLFRVPDEAAGIKFTVPVDQVCCLVINIYEGGGYESIPTASLYDKVITIKNNSFHAAQKTDYTPGPIVSQHCMYMNGYKNIVISDNDIVNCVSDVIVIDNCDRVIMHNNSMIGSPSYCEIYNAAGELDEVATGEGSHYYNISNTAKFRLENNTAIPCENYDGEETPYVSEAVIVDDSPYTPSSTNYFEVAE